VIATYEQARHAQSDVKEERSRDVIRAMVARWMLVGT
jgi:hypothetical protein